MAKRDIEDIRKDVQTLSDKLEIKIRFKESWWLMKLLGVLLFFNKRFMTSFTTTIGKDVAFPTREFIEDSHKFVRIMVHEMVHIEDNRWLGIVLYRSIMRCP